MSKNPTKNQFRSDFLKITFIALIYSLIVFGSQWATLLKKKTVNEYETIYSQSQYVLGDARKQVMGDGDIYTYAGIRYVQGEDVTKINFEHPPLIKYLFGLSFLVLGNPNWTLVPLLFIAIYAFWYLVTLNIRVRWGQWLALLILLAHPSIYHHLPQTMLDFPMTAFLLLLTVFYCRLMKKSNYASGVIFGLCAGILLLTKYPFPLLFIYVLLLYIFLFFKKIRLKILFSSLVVLIVTYLVGYVSYFTHHSLLDFLRFEWWRLHWFMGKTDNPKFMIWQTIFQGKYPKWWDRTGGFISLKHWNLLFPMTVILYLCSFIQPLKRQMDILFPYKIWILISLIAYSFGAAEDRFLVPLIPGFAIFGAQFLSNKLSKS